MDSIACGSFPVVGIGASAGGLAAFEAFFSAIPADSDPGAAFVLIQHLAPDHKSILSELIRRRTQMQVLEAENDMELRPNCIYVIPPNVDMSVADGCLHLQEPAAARGHRLPIDSFFNSLAQEYHKQAIGIVLAGTGQDGTEGLRAIKAAGGMAMAQSPETTEHDGMPASAIAAGLVDYQLAPEEMPAQLRSYLSAGFGSLPALAGSEPGDTDLLDRLFAVLRKESGHDFSHYKRGTVHRRIERRMAVHQSASLADYVLLLEAEPVEAEALFRDLLIGVTSFFRDTEAFKALAEQGLPGLFSGKPSGSTIRAWVPGCSTGEEAYSIAILLQEFLETHSKGYSAQVFATDIDSEAIAAARCGVFPPGISVDVSPLRLERFFSQDDVSGSFRIRSAIREMLVLSEQDVLRDPPFSRLDLISCRNLIIYMDGELQKRLIPLFHYALNPGGILFLGSSESVGEFSDLFSVVDRKSRIYMRREDNKQSRAGAVSRYFSPIISRTAAQAPSPRMLASPELPLRELTERALLRYSPLAGILVNQQGDILYLHGRTGLYLEPAPGRAEVNNVLRMSRQGLQRELSSALRHVVANGQPLSRTGVRVKTNGDYSLVDFSIHPLTAERLLPEQADPDAAGAVRHYLVMLQPSSSVPLAAAEDIAFSSKDAPAMAAMSAQIEALMQELATKEDYLQLATEELETSNEELRSSNEEMQSVNEELQSTVEELETSKEELQSVNEELATVNAELQSKVAGLSQANSDMNNLLSGTGIATVFVDLQLRILRFTPTATRIINLILSDIGRPLGHIASNLIGYDRLLADAQQVLNTLIPFETDVQTLDKKWFSLRIQPYRTLENVIEGAVVSFVDITAMKEAQAELKLAMQEIRTLHGILPICARCKKIRDEQGYWKQLEIYVHDHSDATFSHGLCPDCMKILYPDISLAELSPPSPG